MIIFAKVQTNRVTLKKYMHSFQEDHITGERLIAPRPLPGEMQGGYILYLKLKKDSNNYISAKRFKKYFELSKQKYNEEVSLVKYSWDIKNA